MKTNQKSINASNNNGKSKKGGGKDRKKRKSQPPINSDSVENSDETPIEGNAYAGLGADIIENYFKQSLSGETCREEFFGDLAEDLTYKLKLVINNAITRARLLGRNTILPNDLNGIFSVLNISPSLGCTSNPIFLPIPEIQERYLYLHDEKVDLFQLLDEDQTVMQCSDVVILKKWLNNHPEGVSVALRRYFNAICTSLLSTSQTLRKRALNDVSCNNLIGPIVKWFYTFCHILLAKDTAFENVAGMHLLIALTANRIASHTITKNQISGIFHLLHRKLFSLDAMLLDVNLVCHCLLLLCNEETLFQEMQRLLADNMNNANLHFNLITFCNKLPPKYVALYLKPNLCTFLLMAKENRLLVEPLLCTYQLLNGGRDEKVYEQFHADYCVSLHMHQKSRPFLDKVNMPDRKCKITSEQFRRFKKVPVNISCRKVMDIKSVFDVPTECQFLKAFESSHRQSNFSQSGQQKSDMLKPRYILKGKRPSLCQNCNDKSKLHKFITQTKCIDHTFNHLIL